MAKFGRAGYHSSLVSRPILILYDFLYPNSLALLRDTLILSGFWRLVSLS